MAGHQAVRRAGEAAVGEQCDRLAQAFADQRRGDAEHLAHARPADRPLVADDDHVARLDAALLAPPRTRPPRIRRRARGPRCSMRSWPATFTTQPSGARLPLRMTRPPVDLSGSLSGRTTACPGVSLAPAGFIADRAAGDGQRVRVQQSGLEQALGDQRDTAGLVEIGGDEAPTRLEVAEQRRARADGGRSRRCASSTPAS